jgi:hypothetical protein
MRRALPAVRLPGLLFPNYYCNKSVRVQFCGFDLRLTDAPCRLGQQPRPKSCSGLQVQKSKAGTGRVVAFRELSIANAFTLEASFAGPATGPAPRAHFNAGDLEDMGAALVGGPLGEGGRLFRSSLATPKALAAGRYRSDLAVHSLPTTNSLLPCLWPLLAGAHAQ